MKNRFSVFEMPRGSLFSFTRVTGKITGPDSKPLIGVTVTAKGTNVATTTGADGTYALVMLPKADFLIFSSVGYEGYNNDGVHFKIDNQ